jgi:hypothetical protein
MLDAYWADWTRWFNDIEETRCSTPILVFFRSPAPERNWVTAAGTILDSASLVASTIESETEPFQRLPATRRRARSRLRLKRIRTPRDDRPSGGTARPTAAE